MSPLLVGGLALVGAALGPFEAAWSRPIHERWPSAADLADRSTWRSGRALACAVASAGLFALAALGWGWSWRLVPHLLLVAVLVVVTVVDLEHFLIPNRLVFPSLGAALGAVVVTSLAEGRAATLGPALLGAGLFSAALLVAHLLSPGGMGLGDVKLALLLGLFVGWGATGHVDAVQRVLLALLVASGLGSIVGLVLLARRGRGSHYPFGPWLATGTLVVLLAGAS